MKKILIIGSEGFIGSNLTNYFSSQDYKIYMVDVVDLNKKNYIKVCKTNPDYESIFKKYEPDFCLNCSGAASVPYSFEAPLGDFNLNVFNVVKMLDAIRLYSPKCKFINFSSAAVYGNPLNIPINENSEKKPISPYGYHKMLVESVLEEYNTYFNLKTCTLRLFSAYGNGLKKQIMYDLFKKFTDNDIVHLFGTGEETRDYIHIYDICKIVELVLSKSNFDNDIINIANGEEIKLRTIVDIFQELLNSNKRVEYTGDARTGDPLRWKADITRIKKWGYSPYISIKTGIEEYIKWIKKE